MITLTNIKEHWEIRFKDIDPDTGDVINDLPMSISLDEQSAGSIVSALNLVDEEPNRRYYMIKINALSPSEIKDKYFKSRI